MSSSRYNQDKRVEEVEKLTAEHEEFVGELNASVSAMHLYFVCSNQLVLEAIKINLARNYEHRDLAEIYRFIFM